MVAIHQENNGTYSVLATGEDNGIVVLSLTAPKKSEWVSLTCENPGGRVPDQRQEFTINEILFANRILKSVVCDKLEDNGGKTTAWVVETTLDGRTAPRKPLTVLESRKDVSAAFRKVRELMSRDFAGQEPNLPTGTWGQVYQTQGPART